MRRAIEKYIEAELYDYPDMAAWIEEIREDIIESGVTLEQALLGSKVQANRHYDPSQAKGIELATNRRLKKLVETKKAIEKVCNRLRPDQKRLVEMKYWERQYTDHAIARQLHIGEATFYRWQHRIVYQIAVELGMANAVELGRVTAAAAREMSSPQTNVREK